MVKFHFTTYAGPDAVREYKYSELDPALFSNKDLLFTLSLEIHADTNNSVVEGKGALSYLNVALPPSPLKPAGLPTLDQLKVVGVALATTTGGTYGAVLPGRQRSAWAHCPA